MYRAFYHPCDLVCRIMHIWRTQTQLPIAPPQGITGGIARKTMNYTMVHQTPETKDQRPKTKDQLGHIHMDSHKYSSISAQISLRQRIMWFMGYHRYRSQPDPKPL
ncbi:MAG: hypothetical protein ACI9BH_002603 [Paracoccaceae bacterium]|jgi:hypothetical protein